MSGMYDEMREAPDPRQTEQLRQRLLAALQTGPETDDSAVSHSGDDRDGSGVQPPSLAQRPPDTVRWSKVRIAAVAAGLVLVVGGLAVVSNLRDRDRSTPVSPAGPPNPSELPASTSTTTTTTSPPPRPPPRPRRPPFRIR